MVGGNNTSSDDWLCTSSASFTIAYLQRSQLPESVFNASGYIHAPPSTTQYMMSLPITAVLLSKPNSQSVSEEKKVRSLRTLPFWKGLFILGRPPICDV